MSGKLKCATCKDTGQVWTPELDGSGMWDMACPDCDTPYPPPESAPRELCGSCDAGLPMSCTCPPAAHPVGDNCGLKGDDWYRAHGYLPGNRLEQKS